MVWLLGESRRAVFSSLLLKHETSGKFISLTYFLTYKNPLSDAKRISATFHQ